VPSESRHSSARVSSAVDAAAATISCPAATGGRASRWTSAPCKATAPDAGASTVAASFEMLTDRIDAVIHARAGLHWPPSGIILTAIHKWDRVLLSTEWRDLMTFPKPYEFGQLPLPDVVSPHPSWQHAASEMLELCTSLLPSGGR
jgi:hypothetical protein